MDLVDDLGALLLRFGELAELACTGQYLAVDGSKFWIVSTKNRSPLIRFWYEYDARTTPHSHIHVHAERGTLLHLLTRTQRARAHDMSALHLHTGGSRFRPDLEDVVQFLITECGVDRSSAGRPRSTSGGRSPA